MGCAAGRNRGLIRDAGEAQRIADWYERIISAIERQIDDQGGW
jgi:hypothetical protein